MPGVSRLLATDCWLHASYNSGELLPKKLTNPGGSSSAAVAPRTIAVASLSHRWWCGSHMGSVGSRTSSTSPLASHAWTSSSSAVWDAGGQQVYVDICLRANGRVGATPCGRPRAVRGRGPWPP
jgi:hypothetical protein